VSGRWADLLYLIPILLISLTAHELAHGWVAYRMGDPTAKSAGRLSLNPLRQLDPIGTLMFIVTYLFWGVVFGWAKPIPVSPYYFKSRQRGMAIVGAAGPATNFVIAIVFGLILRFAGPALHQNGSSVDNVLLNILFMFVQINIVLGVFNLIPIPPLDGSRVVGGFLPRRAYEYWVSIDRYGFIILIVVLFAFQSQFSAALHWAISHVWNLIFIGSELAGIL
jgi:Zn-dependent protease